MTVSVTFDPDFSTELEADPIIAMALAEAVIVDGSVYDQTATSFGLSISIAEGSIFATLSGSDFTFAVIDDVLQLTSGTIDGLDLGFTITGAGTFEFFSATGFDTDFADIAPAILADRTGDDDTAMEDFFLGFDWEYTLNDSAADADNTNFFADGDVPFNMTGDDVIYAKGGNDKLFSGDGRDKLYGGTGKDTLDGGAGADLIFGGKGADKLFGGKGSDKLDGNNGDDVLSGGNGSDRLFNSKGSDLFIGGLGRDTFIFDTQSELVNSGDTDKIKGFEQGKDLIDLSGIDANVKNAANVAFVFIGDEDFNGTQARRLRVEDQDGNAPHLIQGDVDGDGTADFEIKVFNFDGTFEASDFIL
ncbi:calcium-binding protein [Algirhabdus cladophorae]|uniref:calcium-binding protein n=1 Tax=Algirhabdus cladophorae TaxID=3377108 RepID=UPI003B848214